MSLLNKLLVVLLLESEFSLCLCPQRAVFQPFPPHEPVCLFLRQRRRRAIAMASEELSASEQRRLDSYDDDDAMEGGEGGGAGIADHGDFLGGSG